MAEGEPDRGAPVIDWLLHEGRTAVRMREFGDEMCQRIVEAGIPIWRAFCAISTLHPLVAATAYLWHRDEGGTTRLTASYDMRASDAIRNSPPGQVKQTGKVIRQRLDVGDDELGWDILKEFRDAGGTDYLALPMRFSDGSINPLTFATDRPGGFSGADIAALTEIGGVLGLIVELQSARRTARLLLDTYVGTRTGQRVLSGAITRGSREDIEAVIWFTDLRGFTALTDGLARDELIKLLNDYFEITGAAVAAEGGEILKFVGDAMLAIFEVADHSEAPPPPPPRSPSTTPNAATARRRSATASRCTWARSATAISARPTGSTSR